MRVNLPIIAIALVLSHSQLIARLSVTFDAISSARVHARRNQDTNKEKRTNEGQQKPNDHAQTDAFKEAIRFRALELLKSIPDRARLIDEVVERTSLLSSTSELLWKYDESQARAILSDTVDQLLTTYKGKLEDPSKVTSRKEDLESSIRFVLKTLARKDPARAEAAITRYHSIREESLQESSSSVNSLNERLSMAKESLDLSARQSVIIASKALDYGVPQSFPQYLFDLSKVDKVAADTLFLRALRIMSVGSVYSPGQVVLLSAYPFSEHWLVQLSASVNKAGQAEFGTFTSTLSPPLDEPDIRLARQFLDAALAFLNFAAARPEYTTRADALYVGRCLFLARKLALYAAKFGFDPEQRWVELEHRLDALARSAGFNPSMFDGPRGFAERLVAQENLFQFDSGTSAFEKAKTVSKPEDRTALTARGIVTLMDEGKYNEAEQKLVDIEDLSSRRQVADYLNFHAGRNSVLAKEWNEVTIRANRIEDHRMRLFLLLDAARAAIESKSRNRALEFLVDVRGILPKIDDKAVQAKGLIYAAKLFFSVDIYSARVTLIESNGAINKAADFDGGDVRISISVPGASYSAHLPDSGLESCYQKAASDNWNDAIETIAYIRSAKLRLMAEIAACRAVL
jgi:hypothetical protein